MPISGSANLMAVPKHETKISLDSLYSSLNSQSFSLSSSEFGSSDDSVNINRIESKTKELQELINTRLTAFLYMSQRLCEEEELNGEVKRFRRSLDRTLSYCFESEVYVKNVLEQIADLQKEFDGLEQRIGDRKGEIRQTEEEIENLRLQQESIESNISRVIEESREKNFTTCQCRVM